MPRMSLCVSRGTAERLLRGNFSELECLPRLAPNQGACVSFPDVDEPEPVC